jgi:hypothetical protein
MIMQAKLLLFILAFCPTLVFAVERAGVLSIDEVYLEPSYITRETEGGKFSLGQSSFSLKWEYKERYRARIAIGSLEERYIPQIYDQTIPSRELGAIEGYAEYDGIYGRVRLGLIPLNFGYGGFSSNHDLVFTRSAIYDQRIVARRDFGLSFMTSHNGFYTEIIAHNGELDQNASDGDVWTTANWGWTNDRNMRAQLSMQVGRTTFESTAAGESGLAGFDPTTSALWKIVDFSLHWFPKRSEVVLQSTWGEAEQDNIKNSFSSNDLELVRMFSSRWGFGLRYNFFDENRKVKDDGVSNAAVALVSSTEERTSRVFLTYNRRTEEGEDIASDEFRLVWRLIPYF